MKLRAKTCFIIYVHVKSNLLPTRPPGRLHQPSALWACPHGPDSIIGKKHVSPRLSVELITQMLLCKYTRLSEQQYFPFKCNLLSRDIIVVLSFRRIDVGIHVNDDVKSLLEIFLIQFVGETLLSSSTGFLWRHTPRSLDFKIWFRSTTKKNQAEVRRWRCWAFRRVMYDAPDFV